MKQIYTLMFFILVSLTSCNKNKSSKIASYSYSGDVELNAVLDKKLGHWIKEGCECYGIVAITDENGKTTQACPIKSKVIIIHPNEIKVKALESVNLGRLDDCSKMGLDVGESWWENRGELFQSEIEALAYLKKTLGLVITQKEHINQ